MRNITSYAYFAGKPTERIALFTPTETLILAKIKI
jgi:hypothetical protein